MTITEKRLMALFYAIDPAGLARYGQLDEYSPEVLYAVSRLRRCKRGQAEAVLEKLFRQQMFDEELIGPGVFMPVAGLAWDIVHKKA